MIGKDLEEHSKRLESVLKNSVNPKLHSIMINVNLQSQK